MKRWNERTRKPDGWVERRRRLQKLFAESVRSATGERVPALASATASETPATVRIRGEE
jgi:hypothetical protein